MPTIGFLCTLSKANADHLLAAFENGVKGQLNGSFAYAGSGPAVPAGLAADEVFVCTRYADGDFANLSPLAQQLKNISPAPKVIAATGGVKSSKAVQIHTRTIPIVFMSGREKVNEHDDHTSNAKGLYLDTTKFAVENLTSFRELRSLGIPRVKIFALVNKNSKVHDDEKDWTNAIIVKNSDLDEAFGRIMSLGSAVGGLVVSADPFFHDNKAKIVNFANNVFGKPVCYPFSEYVSAGGLMSAGPDLATRYTQTGEWAADVINGNLGPKQLGRLKSKGKAKPYLVVNQSTANSQLDKAKRDELLVKADSIINTARGKRARSQ